MNEVNYLICAFILLLTIEKNPINTFPFCRLAVICPPNPDFLEHGKYHHQFRILQAIAPMLEFDLQRMAERHSYYSSPLKARYWREAKSSSSSASEALYTAFSFSTANKRRANSCWRERGGRGISKPLKRPIFCVSAFVQNVYPVHLSL